MNNSYCILPFIHLYSQPDGELKPCCIAGGFDDPINLKTMSIEEGFNSQQMKNLRKDMIDGIRNKVCDVCYKQEDETGHSPRLDFNKNSLWDSPIVDIDYSVPSDFQHVDIRFSNLCNFKCRMCSHAFSSAWYEDTGKFRPWAIEGKPKVMKVTDTIVDDLIPHLSQIKSFYFAGGEPLIMPEHFKILKYLYDEMPLETFYNRDKDTDELIEFDARNLSIHYNTNLSVIKYDEESLIDLWKGFFRVFLSISCDGVGEVGEYQRTGFKTEKFEKNLKIIKKYAKPASSREAVVGISYNFQYTTTIMNVYHIFDFIDYMLEKNHITSSEQIDLYYAWSPDEIALNNLNEGDKINVINFLKTKKENYAEKTSIEIQNIIEFVKNGNQSEDSKKRRLDYIREVENLQGGHFENISKINI
jgi:organic radical activating enzyme